MTKTDKLSAAEVADKIERNAIGKYADGGGLYLSIPRPHAASWVFRQMLGGGRERNLGLGSAREVSLKNARVEASLMRGYIAAGKDPQIERDRRNGKVPQPGSKDDVSFCTVAERFIAQNTKGWRNAKHAAQWSSTLKTYAYPVIGNKDVAAITRADITAILKPIWHSKNETARRVRMRIEAVLGSAVADNLRPETLVNPATWDKVLKAALGKAIRNVKHHEAIHPNDIPEFMARLYCEEGIAADALAFLLLNAVRTGDIIGTAVNEDAENAKPKPPAEWTQLDKHWRVWTLPGTKAHNGKPLQIPLSDAARAVLKKVKAQNLHPRLIFPSPDIVDQPLSNGAMLALLDRMPGYEEATPHGMRSSFKDWADGSFVTAADGQVRRKYEKDLVEEAMAHQKLNKVEGAYVREQRCEQRRPMMQAWAVHAMSAIDNVVQLRRKA